MDGHFTALLGGADADVLTAISILARTRMRSAEQRRLPVAPGGSAALRVNDPVRVASMARRARRSSLGRRLMFRRPTPGNGSAGRPTTAAGSHRPRGGWRNGYSSSAAAPLRVVVARLDGGKPPTLRRPPPKRPGRLGATTIERAMDCHPRRGAVRPAVLAATAAPRATATMVPGASVPGGVGGPA